MHVQFRLKIDSIRLSLSLIGSSLTELTFLNKMSVFPEIGILTQSVESNQKNFRQSWLYCFGTLQCFNAYSINGSKTKRDI